jgi:hypothetical protein
MAGPKKLVIGASGFLGSHVTRQLVQRGDVFYCVVDTRAWLRDPAPLFRTNVEGLRHVLDATRAGPRLDPQGRGVLPSPPTSARPANRVVHYLCPQRPSVRRSRHDEATANGTLVNALVLTVSLAAGAVFMAIVIHDVQLRLEQWDYQRHADD